MNSAATEFQKQLRAPILELLEFYFNLRAQQFSCNNSTLFYFWCSMELSDEALIYLRAPIIPTDLDREKSQDILLEPRVPTIKLKSRWKRGR
ncbi:hypothetical protein KY285_023583 [Solanum tuberosum]|nr:hypothetical protein KY289_023912 [Solanum tuberosum]KAH0675782.1 hypothetical protein KY285_023583 [Solanum tuberosum]